MASVAFTNQPLLTAEQLESRLGEFHRAVLEFNDGYYFEAHETLEDLWMVAPLPEREFFQAVIQLAAALVHFARGEQPGIIKLLDAATEKFDRFAPLYLGVDVAALVDGCRATRDEIAQLGPERFVDWDETRAPQIQRV